MLLGWQPLQVIGALRVPQHAAGDAVASATHVATASRKATNITATQYAAIGTHAFESRGSEPLCHTAGTHQPRDTQRDRPLL